MVILWFAWQSKWETTENGVVEVTEIEEGEKLRRVGDGVVRDVCDVFSANNRPWASSFCPDGRVVLSDRKDQNETTKYLTSMDSTFAETLPTRVIDNLQGCGTHRSDILALESDDKRSVLFQTWDCDDTILKLPARHGTYGTICGNVFVCETRSSETRIIFPILNPSCAIEVKHPECFCFNETLIAFGDVDHVQKIGRLRIVRIHDMKEIADIELPIYLLIQRAAKMTRFNIFLAYTDEGHEPYEKDTYAVFDLCGRRLHDLHLTVGPDLCTDVVMENCFSFEGWISADSPDPLYLSNPVDRTNLWMVMRDAMEVGRMNDGYFFVTMEYPVDGDGVRTGGARCAWGLFSEGGC